METNNNKKEKWTWWEPEGLSLKGCMAEKMWELNPGLSFEVHRGLNNIVYEISFKGYLEYYSFRDEGNAQGLINHLMKEYGKKFLSGYDFYQVHNSKLIDYLYDNEVVSWEKEEIKHFCFMNDDGVYDILTRGTPKINHV